MKKLVLLILILGAACMQAQTRYELYCPHSSIDSSRVILYSQLGLKELTGRNDGANVELYLKSVGLNPKSRNPYCYAGQYYCFSLTAYNPLPKTGLCQAFWNFSKKNGSRTALKPERDDIIVWLSKKGTGHVERVVKVGNSGWVQTIGFNTSNNSKGSQDNGGGVYLKERNIYHPLSRFILNRGLVGFYER